MNGTSLVICDCHLVKFDFCVGAWRRWRGVFDRNLSILITEGPVAGMPIVRCKEDVDYCCRVCGEMSGAIGEQQRDGMNQSLGLSDKPYTKLYIVPGGRLRTHVLELEIRQRNSSLYAFLLG